MYNSHIQSAITWTDQILLGGNCLLLIHPRVEGLAESHTRYLHSSRSTATQSTDSKGTPIQAVTIPSHDVLRLPLFTVLVWSFRLSLSTYWYQVSLAYHQLSINSC